MDMITGKGPSARHEIWYFGEASSAPCVSTISSIVSSTSLRVGWAKNQA